MTGRGLLPHLRALTWLNGTAVRLGLAPGAMDVVSKPAAQRQLSKAAPWATRRPTPGVQTQELVVPTTGAGVRVRQYLPPGAAPDGPALLYLHGGGFLLGGLDAAHWLCNEIALLAGVPVTSVEYRLAPDDPHPAALDDCYAALQWLAASGVDATRIAVAGDSAGGNLAAALALLTRERGGPSIAHQTLIYPLLDTRISSPSWDRWAGGGVDAAVGRRMVELWVGDSPTDDPLVAPLLAEDLTELPPAHVVLAECDVLHDDGEQYAARLLEAGVPARVSTYARMPHGFLAINRLCPAARPAVRDIARELRRALRPEVSAAEASGA